MNPVELSREQIERMLESLAPLPPDYLRPMAAWEIAALCLAALRGMESQGVTDAMVERGCAAIVCEGENVAWTVLRGANDLLTDDALANNADGVKQDSAAWVWARAVVRAALEAALGARTQPRGEREPNWRTEGPHCPTCDCATPAKDSE